MAQTPFQVHRWWFIRMTVILLVTVLVDGIVVWFAKRPLPWAAVIPATLPLTISVFVIIPLLGRERRGS